MSKPKTENKKFYALHKASLLFAHTLLSLTLAFTLYIPFYLASAPNGEYLKSLEVASAMLETAASSLLLTVLFTFVLEICIRRREIQKQD